MFESANITSSQIQKAYLAASGLDEGGPSFHTPLTHTLNSIIGYGPATLTRSTTATVEDFEGRLIEVKANEARFAWARRVENLLQYSEDFSNGKWLKSNVTVSSDAIDSPIGSQTADKVSLTAVRGMLRQISTTVPDGKKFIGSVYLKAGSLTKARIGILGSSGGLGFVYKDITLTTTWQRFAITGDFTGLTGGDYVRLRIYPGEYDVDSSGYIYVWGAQIEDVTGQTNQNPSEYVSTNVLSAPYHGAGVDGVKYFPYENGNTVDANGVVTEAQGPAISSTTLKGIHREGQRTNSLLYCRDLSNAVWSNTNTPVITQNQVGIDGVANTAWTIEDDGATIEYIYQTLTIPDDSNTHTLSVFIKKDNDETRFPEIQCVLKGGTTPVYHIVQVNTKTGAYYNRINTNSDLTEIEDWGDWWRVKVNATNNSSGNTSLQVSIYPAVTTTWGTTESAATGSIVIDWPQVELNSSFPSSPIYTEGTAVTRSSDILTYPDQIPYGTASYTLYAEVEFVTSFPAPSHFLRRDSFGPWTYTIFGYNGPTGFTIAEYDGSMGQSVLKAVTITGGQMYRVISRKNSNYTVGYDGSLSSGGSVISPRLATEMYVGSSSAGNALYGYIKNIKIWRKALSDAQLVRETS